MIRYCLAFITTLVIFAPICLWAQSEQHNIIPIRFPEDWRTYYLIGDSDISEQGWDTLSEVKFWKQVMHLTPDSAIINIPHNRQIITKISYKKYESLRRYRQRQVFKSQIRDTFNLDPGTPLYITAGKSHYYHVDDMLESITTAVRIFTEEGTDPWYAQAILLIESPGSLRKSRAGAYGPFQLMSSVARDFGLRVSPFTDERESFSKSSRAAARFIQSVCVSETREMLQKARIPFSENSLWFRLLVLHVYHAGAGNVARAMSGMEWPGSGPDLIRKLWHTRKASFGNASQNYSQIALAALLELEDYIYQQGGYPAFQEEYQYNGR